MVSESWTYRLLLNCNTGYDTRFCPALSFFASCQHLLIKHKKNVVAIIFLSGIYSIKINKLLAKIRRYALLFTYIQIRLMSMIFSDANDQPISAGQRKK
ncbi:MAG: hypothetical protein HY881_03965 [Deltaproteobacteria bacterium]|nr:hypothetical protein [Deltaproteobacteria bacterium]